MDRDAPAPRNILRSIISEEAPNAIIHHDPSSTAVRKYKFTTILARLTSRLWNGCAGAGSANSGAGSERGG